MNYTFCKDRYVTSTIEKTVPLEVILELWQLLDRHIEESERKNRAVDYLQIFKFSVNGNAIFVEHSQEQPPYTANHLLILEFEYDFDELQALQGMKIYIIDSLYYSTMLFAHEY